MADQKILLLLVILSITSAICCAHSTSNSWCNKTPFPETCKYSIDTKIISDDFVDLHEKDSTQLILETALEKALQAQHFSLGKGQRVQEKTAWNGCYELLDEIVYRLNQTIKVRQCSDFDKQTWLTMAKTNIDTCQMGFREAGMPIDLLFPISNNVSQLISIVLAVNHPKVMNSMQKNDMININGFSMLEGSDDDPVIFLPNVVVAQDGSGNFSKIKDAIRASSKDKWRKGNDRFVIYVKEGSYKEHIEIGHKVTNITIIGDGIGKTIITGNKHNSNSTSTSKSATFAVSGDGFIAINITFQNTAGPLKGQAVALRSHSDHSAFYKCSFEGYQDTLYVFSGRQFYRECDIYGTVDFIFGNAAAVLQKCNIYGQKPRGNEIAITASKRECSNETSGIIIHDSQVSATDELKSVEDLVRIYLGRPWANCSRTVFLNTFLDVKIDPAGWLGWMSSPDTECLYYGEFNNTGQGSSTVNRVNWKGYHNITDALTASMFTASNFFSGDSWIPFTNVPYDSGL